MSLIVKDTKREFPQAPEGLHASVCVDVVDLGLVTTKWGDKPMVRLVWQIEECDPSTNKRFLVMNRYTLSLNQKSRLRPLLEAWRGRKFTEEELKGFDLEKLVGVNCQVQVVHTLGDEGQVYANVQAVVPAAKGSVKMIPEDYIRVKDRAHKPDGDTPAEYDDEVPF